MVISGIKYKLFYDHFDFGSQHLMLAGLIRTNDYLSRVNKVPKSFIGSCLIIIALIFIMIPLIKIFFLSPNEVITARDVFACTVSFFLGTAAIAIIFEYTYLNFSLARINNSRIGKIADTIQYEFEQELKAAGNELTRYDDKYHQLQSGSNKSGRNTLAVLQYRVLDSSSVSATDSFMLPENYWHFTRFSWVDSNCHTIAKWNRF